MVSPVSKFLSSMKWFSRSVKIKKKKKNSFNSTQDTGFSSVNNNHEEVTKPEIYCTS